MDEPQKEKRPDYFKKAHKWLQNLSGLHRMVNDLGGVVSRLQKNEINLQQAHDAMVAVFDPVKAISPDSSLFRLKRALKVLILRPLQRNLSRVPAHEPEPEDKGALIAFVESMHDSATKKNFGEKLMREGLTKGAPASQISQHSQRLRLALNKIIVKLAAMNQPLRNRSDYGTTGDMAERLKKYQDDEIDAAMYKEVLLPNPRPIAPEQERARSRSSVLANVDSKFKKIRSMLKGRGETTLSGVETKTILDALDKIYQEYKKIEDC